MERISVFFFVFLFFSFFLYYLPILFWFWKENNEIFFVCILKYLFFKKGNRISKFVTWKFYILKIHIIKKNKFSNFFYRVFPVEPGDIFVAKKKEEEIEREGGREKKESKKKYGDKDKLIFLRNIFSILLFLLILQLNKLFFFLNYLVGRLIITHFF